MAGRTTGGGCAGVAVWVGGVAVGAGEEMVDVEVGEAGGAAGGGAG